VVFVEHRYYGNSLPFGADSYQKQNVGLLGSEQALADYARFWTYALQLNNSKAMFGLELDAATPVIAFGGSYGGMLAAWMRMRYPNIVYGALAASAPILQFEGLTAPGVFNEIVTADFAAEGECANQLKAGIAQILNLGATAAGRTTLSNNLTLCAALEDGQQGKLYDFIYSAITYMAMVDYPYPSNFLIPLPAWPVKAACAAAASITDPVAAVRAVINVYYNTTGDQKCFDILGSASPTLDSGGWDYQACTEMVMPMSSGGPNDLFPPSAWNLTEYIQHCQDSKKWGVTPRPYWTQTYYGGKKILPATNIIFSNGKLDPWHGGGVLQDQSSSVVAIVIDQSAHHLDLRSPNPADPPSVVAARQREAKIIAGWVKDAKGPGPYNTDWMFATTALMFFAAICATGFLICNGRSQKKDTKFEEPLLE
jgi:lysosomal Pro-X carboxypeptidase